VLRYPPYNPACFDALFRTNATSRVTEAAGRDAPGARRKRGQMSTFDKAVKTEEEVLVAVAETIGSTLGTISAKAGEAKKALLAANSSGKRAAKRTAKTLNRALRSTQRSAKKAVKKAKRARRKSSAKASKAIRKGRKAIRSRMR
jgi:hypothetical protein